MTTQVHLVRAMMWLHINCDNHFITLCGVKSYHSQSRWKWLMKSQESSEKCNQGQQWRRARLWIKRLIVMFVWRTFVTHDKAGFAQVQVFQKFYVNNSLFDCIISEWLGANIWVRYTLSSLRIQIFGFYLLLTLQQITFKLDTYNTINNNNKTKKLNTFIQIYGLLLLNLYLIIALYQKQAET